MAGRGVRFICELELEVYVYRAPSLRGGRGKEEPLSAFSITRL